jgi:hypothetical protein
MRGPSLCAWLLLAACAFPRHTSPPDAAELELRGVEPSDPRLRRVLEPRCAEQVEAADAAFARGALDDASASLARAERTCKRGAGIDWRRGLVAMRAGDYDAAVRALLAELRRPDPIPIAGVHLMQALPHADAHARRVAKWRGRRLDPAGLQTLARDRAAMARCGGRPFAVAKISCNRDPPVCTYTVLCEGGGSRKVAMGSAELWFGTQ